MQPSLEFEIRDRLSACLANEIFLHDFADWFFSKTWDVDKLDAPSLLELVYQIKLTWAEFSDGDLSNKEFRSLLRSLLERYSISASPIRPVYKCVGQFRYLQPKCTLCILKGLLQKKDKSGKALKKGGVSMQNIQWSMTIKEGFLHINDYELQVDVIGSKDGYLIEDQRTGRVLACNVSLSVAYRTATQYRKTHL